ncbi:RND transporter [Paracidovorax avenae]|uniref:efflux transporter outer membrane subunit n=1 Tax=Paracidovorax avenae TaxID=80867 RepID=UPI000D229188|nr:efflux transporter outer membrane subunit [Paracidovorax avenae]AVS67969.1 RND transporter [Paracidovorax avenae]
MRRRAALPRSAGLVQRAVPLLAAGLARRATSLLTALLLAGCGSLAVGPDYHVPAEAAMRDPAAAGPFQETQAQARSNAPGADAALSTDPLPPRWWHLFRDPTLDALVQEALAHNTDLRVAAANLELQQAALAQVRAAEQPQLSLSGGPGFGHVSGLSELAPGLSPSNQFAYSVEAGLSYQVDVVGELRRAAEAAQADSAAAAAALDLARVNVAAGTARAYALACATGQQLKVAESSVSLQKEQLGVVQRLHDAGRAGATDLARSRALLAQLEASPPALQAQRQAALYQLAAWLGRTPGALPAAVQQCAAVPQVAGALPVGDGAALLRRRPDLRRSERQLAAATARIGVATAQLYPKVSLGLSASSTGPAGDFLGRDTFAWNIGPLIRWSLPNTGAVRARIAGAEAGTRMALASFDGAVLQALRETETALSAYRQELISVEALKRARDDSAQVARQAQRLYVGGRSAYLDALDAQRSLATAEASLAAAQARVAQEQVAVFMALGGGWE